MTAIWRPDIPTVQGCITGIEITDMQLTLVKWKMATRPDLSLFVAREVLIGPVGIT